MVRNGETASFHAVNQPGATAPAQNGDSAQSTTSNSTTSTAASKMKKEPPSTRTSTPVDGAGAGAGASESRQNSTPSEAEPQPQTAGAPASTSSSNGTAKEPKEPPAAPYGTRSRNRTGRASRVNYAEDVEMDFEMAPASSHDTSSDPPSRASVATENAQSTGLSAKKGSGAGQQGHAPWGHAANHSKDSSANPNPSATPTSTSTPGPAPAPPPKRRKNAAAHAATNGNHHASANAAAPSHTAAKRANAATQMSSARESNMMTFENTGAMLQGDHMVADDGQTVSLNGE